MNQSDIVVRGRRGFDEVSRLDDLVVQQFFFSQAIFYGWENVIPQVQVIPIRVD
jgi:hypothetical protein